MNADPEAQFYNFDAASPDGLVGTWPPCLSPPEGVVTHCHGHGRFG